MKRSISKIFPVINSFMRDIIEIHKDLKILESCFSDVYPRYFDNNSVASYAFNVPAISFLEKNEIFLNIVIEKSEIFSKNTNINPIFFYAHVGQGKTTYLKHLIHVKIHREQTFELLKKSTYFLYVAFTSDDSKCSYIMQDFRDELENLLQVIFEEHNIKEDFDTLSEIFNADLIRFKRIQPEVRTENFLQYILGEKGNEGYTRQKIKWLLNKKRIKICCIVDNIDQHLLLHSKLNAFIKTFQDIHSFNIQLIIPLRISNKGIQNLNFFDAFSPINITLGIPDYAQLVSKRINYIERHYMENLGQPIIVHENESLSLTKEIFTTLKSIANLIDKTPQVKKSLEYLSNLSPRSYINMMVDVFSSWPLFYHPLTNEKIDYKERVSRGKFQSLFLYSLMLRNNQTHKENDKNIPIINLFDNRTYNCWNSFIRYHLLSALKGNTGCIHITKFIDIFREKYNIDKKAIKIAIKTFIKKKCVSYICDSQLEVEDTDLIVENETCSIELSPRGLYHLDLATELEYYEILAIPRLLKERTDYQSIRQTTKQERAENLLNYLNELKKDEEGLKAIFWNQDYYKENLLWTNNVYDNLIKEYKQIFEKDD